MYIFNLQCRFLSLQSKGNRLRRKSRKFFHYKCADISDSLTREGKGEESVTTQKDESPNIHHVDSGEIKRDSFITFSTVQVVVSGKSSQ